MCFGEFSDSQLTAEQRSELTKTLLDVYRNDPDRGLHSAAGWLLRQWDQAQQVERIDTELRQTEKHFRAADDTSRQWYVNGQGQTFVILESDKKDIPRFAICTTEVTHEQWKRSQIVRKLDPGEEVIAKYPTQGDWYTAVEYCNWLSVQDGLPKYYKKTAGKWTTPDKKGYRLPTWKEWNYACRAGATTSRFYGETTELLENYAMVHENPALRKTPAHRENVKWPVAGKSQTTSASSTC